MRTKQNLITENTCSFEQINTSIMAFIYICLSLIFIGCSDDDSDQPPAPEPKVLTTIEIVSSDGTSLEVGQTTTLTLNGFDQDGQNFDISSTINWSSNSTDITVDSDGMVSGVAEGNATITAETLDLETTLNIEYTETTPNVGFEIFVSDANGFDQGGPWKIIRYDGDGTNGRIFTDENLGWPQDIVILEEEGEVLVSNLNTGRITKYDLDTGDYIEDFAVVSGGPTRMNLGPDGLLYVLQWQGDGTVLRYNRDGTFVDEFTSVGVDRSIGMDWDSDGNLYISSFGDKTVRKFDSSGVDMGLFLSSNLFGPTDLLFIENGTLLVNDWNAGFVFRFSSTGTFLGPFASGLGQVEGIAVTPNNTILVGNGSGSSVKEYEMNGTLIGDLITSNSGDLIQPNAITVRELE